MSRAKVSRFQKGGNLFIMKRIIIYWEGLRNLNWKSTKWLEKARRWEWEAPKSSPEVLAKATGNENGFYWSQCYNKEGTEPQLETPVNCPRIGRKSEVMRKTKTRNPSQPYDKNQGAIQRRRICQREDQKMPFPETFGPADKTPAKWFFSLWSREVKELRFSPKTYRQVSKGWQAQKFL